MRILPLAAERFTPSTDRDMLPSERRELALPAGALIVAGAAGAIATGRRRNVEPIEIAPSEPALVA